MRSSVASPTGSRIGPEEVRRPEHLAARNPAWLAGITCLSVAIGIAAGVNPQLGLEAALATVFAASVIANVTVGVVLFCVLSFLEVIKTGGAGVSQLKVAGFVLFVSWLANTSIGIRRKVKVVFLDHPGLAVSGIALISWSLLSLAWAENRGTALVNTNRFLLDFLLFPIVFTAVRRREHVFAIIGAFMFGAVLSAGYALINPGGATNSGRLLGALGEPNQQATVLVAAIVLGLGLLRLARRLPGLRLPIVVGIVLAAVGLVGTFSRAGLASLVCVMLAGVAFGGRWRGWALLLLAVGGTAMGTYFLVIQPGSRVTTTGTTGRSDLWAVAFRIFSAHPVTGVGAGNYTVAAVHYLQQPGNITRADLIVDRPTGAQSIYLELLADLGLPGLIAFLGVVATAIGAGVRAARRFEQTGDRELELVSRGLVLALLGFLTADLFAAEIYSKQLWLLLALCPALFGLSRAPSVTVPQ